MQAGGGLGSSFIGRWAPVSSFARGALCHSTLVVWIVCAVWLPGVARAQEAPVAPVVPTAAASAPVMSPQAQAALSQLLQLPSAAAPTAAAGAVRAAPMPSGPMASPGWPAPAGARMQVVVRPGETLDRVIQRTLRDSPFRLELLRDAFVRLNRSAFPRGTPHWLTAGSVLQVPTPADLMSQVDPRWWPAPAQAEPALASSPQSDRRNWVRYP